MATLVANGRKWD